MKPLNTTTIAGAKKFARKLLATTCLTAAGAVGASAATVSEPPDFGNSFASATSLAAGTDRVQGEVQFNNFDYFRFSGLLGGSAYSISGTYSGAGDYAVKDSAGVDLNSSSYNPSMFMGLVPGDGILVIQATNNSEESSGTYDLTLTASSTSTVPEPSTLAAVGLGLAGAVAMRRKLNKK